MEDNKILMNMKVLYVEDDDATREELAFYLKKRVGKLYIARNGEEGLKQFELNRPHIVITDSRMPVMDGITMSAKIREIDKEVSIIVTTAFSDVDVVIKAIDMGVNKYILKPVAIDELNQTLIDSAYKNMAKNEDQVIVGKKMVMNLEEKKSKEKDIQIRIAAFLKEKTGKGPKFVKAFLKQNTLEITAVDALTKYEVSMLEKGKNQRIIQFVRESFYNSYRRELESLVEEIMTLTFVLESVSTDIYHRSDKLILKQKEQ